MRVEKLTALTREHARELWHKYQSHRAHQQPYDAEIEAIYKRLARGQTVVRALASIVDAGLNEQRLPKLAICRADQQRVYWRTHHAYGNFQTDSWMRGNAHRSRIVQVDWRDCRHEWPEGEAIVPLIPVHLRPRRGLQNYHILWEADWARVYPHDPYLLRRFGGDAWLVVAAWDLTEVERAVMSARMTS
jgi:hypothetical protein